MGYLHLSVDDDNLEYEEIYWAERRLWLNQSGSPSEMRAEHLCQWLISETRDNLPDTTNWLKVVAIVQAELCDGTMTKECMW